MMPAPLSSIGHRPWPLPSSDWTVRQDWIDLAFLHWKLSPSLLEPLLPDGLILDTFNDEAWIGIVPFRMDRVRLAYTPAIPLVSSFPELNVRTYVRYKDKAGVLFLSLDAASALTCWAGKRFFHLPYHRAKMQHHRLNHGWHYRSARLLDQRYDFDAEVQPNGSEYYAQSGSIEHFLTERYCFFAEASGGQLLCGEVHHPPWPLHTATVKLSRNGMLSVFGSELSDDPDLVHSSPGVSVVGWSAKAVLGP